MSKSGACQWERAGLIDRYKQYVSIIVKNVTDMYVIAKRVSFHPRPQIFLFICWN